MTLLFFQSFCTKKWPYFFFNLFASDPKKWPFFFNLFALKMTQLFFQSFCTKKWPNFFFNLFALKSDPTFFSIFLHQKMTQLFFNLFALKCIFLSSRRKLRFYLNIFCFSNIHLWAHVWTKAKNEVVFCILFFQNMPVIRSPFSNLLVFIKTKCGYAYSVLRFASVPMLIWFTRISSYRIYTNITSNCSPNTLLSHYVLSKK